MAQQEAILNATADGIGALSLATSGARRGQGGAGALRQGVSILPKKPGLLSKFRSLFSRTPRVNAVGMSHYSETAGKLIQGSMVKASDKTMENFIRAIEVFTRHAESPAHGLKSAREIAESITVKETSDALKVVTPAGKEAFTGGSGMSHFSGKTVTDTFFGMGTNAVTYLDEAGHAFGYVSKEGMRGHDHIYNFLSRNYDSAIEFIGSVHKKDSTAYNTAVKHLDEKIAQYATD